MTDIIKPRYHIETFPIQSEGNHTTWNKLDFRVKDGYTGMPIGVVKHFLEEGKGSFKVFMFLTKDKPEWQEGGWEEARFDLAAEYIWKCYFKTLPFKERFVRGCWRWLAVIWFLIGTNWGVIVSIIASSIVG